MCARRILEWPAAAFQIGHSVSMTFPSGRDGERVSAETVLDSGPIPYHEIELYGDLDLEQDLRHAGFDPPATAYRLIEIPLASIGETATMAEWPFQGTFYADAVRAGQKFPPVVVMRTDMGWTLLDGVNRTYAYWLLGWRRVTAYEVLRG